MVPAHIRFGIAQQFARSYSLFGNRPAVLDGVMPLTYAQLGMRVRQVANALHALGVERGGRVFIATSNRAEFFVIEHAVFAGGYARVAISPKLHPSEAAFIMQDCSACVAFVDGDWAAKLASIRHSIPSLQHVICLDEAQGSGDAIPFDVLMSAETDAPLVDSAQPDDLAALLYTSGTTGTPKGAMMLQRTLSSVARNHLVDLYPVDDTDVVLHSGPLAHMSGVFSWCYFLRGAAHIAMPRFDPVEVLHTIATHGVTTLFLVPTMLNRLTELAEETGFRNTSVRTIMYGASAIAPDRIEKAIRVFGEVLVQCYGQSEFQLISSMLRPAHRFPPGQPPRHLASAGRPHPFVEVRIVGANGEDRPAGEDGDIVVRSDTAMQGYWQRPEASRDTLLQDGWVRTGDMGHMGGDGYLYLVDRRNDMIISGGYNIYPNEIENVMSAVPGVREVAVVGAPDEAWGEAVTAVVVRDRGGPSADELLAACRRQLTAFKVPKRIIFRDELPKSPVGKILRRQVKEEFWQGRTRRIG